MMKRISIAAAALFVVLLVAAALLLPKLADPERYRPKIQQILTDLTGRKVTIGPLRLRVFPLPGVTADGFSVGEDPAYGTGAFLEAQRVDARVRLIPLLSSKLDIVSFDVDKPVAHLKRDAKLVWNVSSLMRQAGGEGAKPKTAEPSGGGLSVVVERCRLIDGTVDIVDAGISPGTPVRLEARKIDLALSDFSPGSPMKLVLGLDLTGEGHLAVDGRLGPAPKSEAGGWPIDAHVVLKGFGTGAAAPYLAHYAGVRLTSGSLDVDTAVSGTAPQDLSVRGKIDLKALHVAALSSGGAPSPSLDGSVTLDASLTPSQTTIRSAEVRLDRATVKLSGTLTGLTGKPKVDARAVASKVAFKDVAPLLSLFGPMLPSGLALKGDISLDARVSGPIEDPAALAIDGTATIAGFELTDPSIKQPVKDIAGSVTLSGDRAQLRGLSASLGRSRIEGTCTIGRFKHPVIDVELNIPVLDVDEILSFLPAGGGAPATPAASSPSSSSSLLRDMTIRGTLAIAETKAMNLKLTGARARLAMENGQAHLAELSARLYGGTLGGDLTAGLVDAGPPFTMSAKIQGVDFNGLCTDFSKDLGGIIHGTLEAGLDVKGRGVDTQALRSQLTGHASLALRNGKLTSFGFLKQLSAALAAVGGRGVGKDETPFNALTGTFDIRDGRATTQDLKLDSPDLGLNGKGSIGLDQSLAMDVGVVLSPSVSADMVAKAGQLQHLVNNKGELALDLKLSGALQKPAIGVDPNMLKRAAESVIKEKGADMLKRLLQRHK